MKKILIILSAILLSSCGSEKSVQRETNKSKKIVIQKFIDEYTKDYNLLQKNVSELNKGTEEYDKSLNEFNEFVASSQNIKLAKEALKLDEILTDKQISELNNIIENGLKDSINTP